MSSLVVKDSLDNEVKALQIVAKQAQESGLYTGVGGEAKIFMILLSAKELGIPPMQALNGGIWNIQGKIEISARMVNNMLRKAGIKINIKRLDSKGCILEGTRPDTGDTCTVSFLEEDANRAGVLGRGPWKTHPEDMYFARAISKLGRRLAPDILGTAYVEGEIEAANEMKVQSPDNLPIAEVQEMKVNEQEQIKELIASWEGDKDEFTTYFKAVCDAYKSKSILDIVEMLRSDPERTKGQFEVWKERKAKKAVAA